MYNISHVKEQQWPWWRTVCSFVFIRAPSLAKQPRWLWRKTLLEYSWCNLGPQLSVRVKSYLHIHYILMSAVWSKDMYFPLWCISQFAQPSVNLLCSVSVWVKFGPFTVWIRSIPPDYCVSNCKQNIWVGREPAGEFAGGKYIIVNCLIRIQVHRTFLGDRRSRLLTGLERQKYQPGLEINPRNSGVRICPQLRLKSRSSSVLRKMCIVGRWDVKQFVIHS